MPASPEKELRKMRREVLEACERLYHATATIDRIMKRPDSKERGEILAVAVNHIDMTKDQLWHFTLGKKLPVKVRRGR